MAKSFLVTPFFLDTPSTELRALARPGWHVNEPDLPQADCLVRLGALHRSLAGLVRNLASQGVRPVCLGGDCCQAIAVLAGLHQSGIRPILLWLDAHGDFNTRHTSPSGFIGGMPLAMIVGRGDRTLIEQVGLEPMPEPDVLLSDARDLDPGEREGLDDSAVVHIRQVEDVPACVPAERPLCVHLDVDVLDPEEAPAMLFPARGGPSLATVEAVAAQLRQTRPIVALSMTAWAFDRDRDGRTARACMGLLDSFTD